MSAGLSVGRPCVIENPTQGDLCSFDSLQADLSPGDDAHRHIEDEGVWFPRRDRYRQRIVPDGGLTSPQGAMTMAVLEPANPIISLFNAIIG